MNEICENCRALCSNRLTVDECIQYVEFFGRSSFACEAETPERELLKQNIRDWKNWLRTQEVGASEVNRYGYFGPR